MKNKRFIGILITVAILLLIPFAAMQFTNEMKWSRFDFVIAGVLLLGAGLTLEFILRTVKKIEYRIALGAALLIALFLVWAELAVGVFGTPFAGN
jgi:hypothetical protein